MSSLGDVVHHCPALSDAARHVPGAEIDWVVEESFAGVAAMHRSVRRVIPVAMRRWRGALWNPSVWSEIGGFRGSLARERYDIVIDTQGLLKSALVCMLASGPVHGMDRASAREPLATRFYDVNYNVPRHWHAVERNRRLAAFALGYGIESPLDYGLSRAARASAGSEDAYVVFLTMSAREEKLWPEARWIELGRSLGARVVLPWGSEEEHVRAKRIAGAIGNATVPDRMALPALAAMLAEAKTVVGVDTGLTHLAVALGARTIGIYCGTDPSLYGLYASSNAFNLGGLGRAPSAAEVLGAAQ